MTRGKPMPPRTSHPTPPCSVLNALKRNAFPWMREVTKNAPQLALMPWGQAFKNFCAGLAEYPTLKKKGQHDRFPLWVYNADNAARGASVDVPRVWNPS